MPPAALGWKFTLAAVSDGAATGTPSSPAAVTSANPALPSAAPTASPTPVSDLADAVARGSLAPRIDILLGLGEPAPTDWEPSLQLEATALREALLLLDAADLDRVAADPAHVPAAIAARLAATNSTVALRFTDTAQVLTNDIRDRLKTGVPTPTGVGMGGFYFGKAYALPVFSSAGGGGSGGGGAPAATPGAGLTLTADGGTFIDGAASESAVAGL